MQRYEIFFKITYYVFFVLPLSMTDQRIYCDNGSGVSMLLHGL